MRFTCRKKDLHKLLVNAVVIASKSMTPNQILMKAHKKEHSISIWAHSFHARMTSVLRDDVDVVEPGKVLILGTALESILSSLKRIDKEEVTIYKDDSGVLKIECGDAEFEIGCFDESRFPPFTKSVPENETFVPCESFQKVAARVLKVFSDQYPQVELKFGDSKMRITSVSSRWMATDVVSCSSDIEDTVYIPHQSMMLLRSVANSSDGRLKFQWSADKLVMQFDDTRVEVNHAHGGFPPYQQIIDACKDGKTKACLDTTEFRAAVKAFDFFLDKKNLIAMKMAFSDNSLDVALKNVATGGGGGTWKMQCEVGGEEIKILFDPDLLGSCTNGMLGSKMTISMNAPNTPALVSFDREPELTYLLMPMGDL